MKKVLSVILAFALIFSAVPFSGISEYLQGLDFGFLAVKSSAASTYDLGYIRSDDGKSFSVELYNKSASGALTIPSTFDGKPVTGIYYEAFRDCASLTSVTIPDSVTSIGYRAFDSCSSLTSINVAAGNENYSSQDGVLFNKDKTELICCPGGKRGAYIVPNNATSIGDYAFSGCTGLTSVTIPDSVTSIGYGAFSGCTGLTSVTIPDSVTSIDSYAFDDCSSLTSVIIGNGVTSIGDDAFSGTAYYNNTANWENGVLYIGNCLIKAKTSLSGAYTVKDGTKCIAGSAFEYCSSLTSVTIPDSVTNIGWCAFYNCSSLASMTIGNGVTSIGDSAFRGCSSLTSVTIPDSVTNIGWCAFCDCSSLTSVTIGNGVTSLEFLEAFRDCSSLKTINVAVANESYSSQDGVLFSKDKTVLICCPAGKTGAYTIPNGVTSIGAGAFEGCDSLCPFIPSTVTEFGGDIGCYWVEVEKGSPAEEYAMEQDISYIVRCDHTFVNGVCQKCNIHQYVDEYADETYFDFDYIEADDFKYFGVDDFTLSGVETGGWHLCVDTVEHCAELIIPETYLGEPVIAATIIAPNVVEKVVAPKDCALIALCSCPAKELTLLNPGNVCIAELVDLPRLEKITVQSTTMVGVPGEYDEILEGVHYFNMPENKENGVLYIGNSLVGVDRNSPLISGEVTVRPGTLNVCSYAFYGCADITSVILPDSVTSIGNYAFYCCSSLASVTISDSVTSIGEGAFGECSSLTSVTIGNGVTSIGYAAFCYCSSLTSVTIGNGVTSIGYGAFAGCNSLTSVTMPDSVTSIGDYAFEDCSKLTSVTIPDSVTSIGDYAFGYIGNMEPELSAGFTIHSHINTAAEAYAKANGIIWEDLCKHLHTENRATVVAQSCSQPGYSAGVFCLDCDNWISGHKITETIPHTDSNRDYICDECSNWICDIIPGTTKEINVNNTTTLEFTPYETGIYVFTSKSSSDTYGYLYDADMNEITHDDESGSGSNFEIRYMLEAGKTYYLGARYYSYYSGSFDVSLSFISFITYTLSDDGSFYILSDCDSSFVGELIIPSTYNGKPVTSIGDSAFENCSSLTSVTIGNSVTSIGNGAFWGCSSLTSVTISDSVTSIGYDAFGDCSSLNAVYITDIAAWCAMNFEYYNSNPLSYAHNLYVNGKLATDIVIPDSVTSIEDYAFCNCSSLTSVTIPDSVTNIGSASFEYCNSLTSVTIGNGVTSIGGSAFSDCSGLTSVTIGNSVTSIGYRTFEGCSSLTSVIIGNSVTSIGFAAFFGCSSLTSVTIPNSVTSIDDIAFCACSSLTEVIIPNSVTSIGISAFASFDFSGVPLSWLTHSLLDSMLNQHIIDPVDIQTNANLVIKSNSNSYARIYADSVCIKWVNNCPRVDLNRDYICDGCGEWICDIIPDATKRINVEAGQTTFLEFTPYKTGIYEFASDSEFDTFGYLYDSEMKEILSDDDSGGKINFKIKYTLEAGKTYYFGARFYSSNIAGSFNVSLSETSPFTFTLNGDGNSYTLSGCDSSYIGALTVPSTYNGKPVTVIGFGAFCDCTGLTSVTIPDSVTVISNKSFYGCKNLVSVTIPNGVKTIGYITFYDCKSLTNVTIPDSVKSIGDCAFEGCGSLESVTVGNGVTSIGKYAFGYCSKLKSAEIPNSVTSIDDTAFFSCGGDLVVYGFRGSYAESYANKNSLTFKATEIISKGSARIDYANNCIFSDETISSLDECLIADKNIALECVKSSLGAIGTGATVRVKTGNTVLGNYTVVVNGDLDGDSVSDVLDAVLAERALHGHGELSAAQAYAANNSADTEISIESYQNVVNRALSA